MNAIPLQLIASVLKPMKAHTDDAREAEEEARLAVRSSS